MIFYSIGKLGMSESTSVVSSITAGIS